MIIIGDALVPFEDIVKITTIDEIKATKPNSTIMFDFDEKVLKYSFENNLKYIVIVDDIKQSIYANSLNARFIVCKKALAKKIQKIADNYMFDAKILAVIKTNDELEEIANEQIDGVIYKELI